MIMGENWSANFNRSDALATCNLTFNVGDAYIPALVLKIRSRLCMYPKRIKLMQSIVKYWYLKVHILWSGWRDAFCQVWQLRKFLSFGIQSMEDENNKISCLILSNLSCLYTWLWFAQFPIQYQGFSAYSYQSIRAIYYRSFRAIYHKTFPANSYVP